MEDWGNFFDGHEMMDDKTLDFWGESMIYDT